MSYKKPKKETRKEPLDFKKKTSIIVNAMAFYNINNHIEKFNDKEIAAICKNFGHKVFSDITIILEDVIIKNLDWNTMELIRSLRLLSRAIDRGCEDHIIKSIIIFQIKTFSCHSFC